MIENIIPNTFRKFDGRSYLLFVKIIEKYFASMNKGQLIIRDPKRDIQLVFGDGGTVEAVIQVNSSEFYSRLVLGRHRSRRNLYGRNMGYAINRSCRPVVYP